MEPVICLEAPESNNQSADVGVLPETERAEAEKERDVLTDRECFPFVLAVAVKPMTEMSSSNDATESPSESIETTLA